MKATQHFAFALVEDFTHLAFSCAVEPLRIANLIAEAPLYDWSFLSEDGHGATSSNGSVTLVHHGFDAPPPCDRLFVLSGLGVQTRITPALKAMLRRQKSHGTSLGALCSGAWILASLGFLDGTRAAIHWDFHDSFSESFPDVSLVRSVFVDDERFLTASGGTATADLMLHLIARDHGEDLSVAVADQMVYSAAREASAQQRVSLQSRHGIRNAHLAGAIRRMQESVDTPVSPTEIAADLGISTRQLERLFGKYLNTSPKKYHMEMRLERARHLLVQTEASVIDVAFACGFESPGHFSRVYKAAFGITPMVQRSRIA